MSQKELNEAAFETQKEFLRDHYSKESFAVFCMGKLISCEDSFGAAFDAAHIARPNKPVLIKRIHEWVY